MADRRFGPYRLDDLLGNGGTGQVWRAHDTRTERTVALKLLARELAADDVYRQRFRREARTAAGLREPHVVPIHTFGEHDGQLFIDMAYVDGSDLGKLLRSGGPLPPATAVDIVSQVAAALDEAHRHGLVHRDVKPSNIIVMPSGFAYLIDFGTVQQIGQSTLTGASLVIGTPAYMAPERFTGTADACSDIYSLACVLFESLTGRRPFPDPDAAAQMRAHLTDEPPRLTDIDPALPAELDALVRRALAKDPKERFDSAGAFAAAARTALARATSATTAPVPAIPAPTKHLTAIQPPVVDRLVGAPVEPADRAVAVSTPPVSAPEHIESPRPPGFPRRFAAGVAVAALLVGAGAGWAVWRADQDPSTPTVQTTQPQAPVAGSSTAAGTAPPPQRSRVETTEPATPPPRTSNATTPPPETTEAPTTTVAPTTGAAPPPTTAPTAVPLPIPNGFTPPGANLPNAYGTPDGGGNGNGHAKPAKPTKPPK